jgi:magnesium-transporting ATPase (P-type)
VFARIRPCNKPKVVKALQNIGHIVAATADGYWTATSRNSDLGISMGISGSDLEK